MTASSGPKSISGWLRGSTVFCASPEVQTLEQLALRGAKPDEVLRFECGVNFESFRQALRIADVQRLALAY